MKKLPAFKSADEYRQSFGDRPMTMVERVAMAIADKIDEGTFYNAPVFQAAARAAIEAMREPTDQMLIDAVPDEDNSGAPYVVDRYIFKIHYQQMISAALAEPSDKG